MNLCGIERDIIGVKAGDGIGVGNSLMGDRHLFALVGTSNKIVVVFIVEFIEVFEDDLYEFVESMVSSIDILGIEYGTEVSDAHWLSGVFIEDDRDTSENVHPSILIIYLIFKNHTTAFV